MRSPNVRLFVLVFAIALSLPFLTGFTSVGAASPASPNAAVSPMGAGEWDYIGSSTFTTSSATANSAGGDFLICLEAGPSGYYNLYEYDPSNADDRVGYVYLYPGACGAFRDIGGFVDGDNKRAEFYVYKAFGGAATISFWD